MKVVGLPWAEAGSRFTALFEGLAIAWLKSASQQVSRCTEIADSVAIFFNTSPRFNCKFTALKSRTGVFKPALAQVWCNLADSS